jgi:hypothetical protein
MFRDREAPLNDTERAVLNARLDHLVYETWNDPALRAEHGITDREVTLVRWVTTKVCNKATVTQHAVRRGPLLFLQMFRELYFRRGEPHIAPDPRSPLVLQNQGTHWCSEWWVCVVHAGEFVFPEEIVAVQYPRPERYRFPPSILPVSLLRTRGSWWVAVRQLSEQFEGAAVPLARRRELREAKRRSRARAETLAHEQERARAERQVLAEAEAAVHAWMATQAEGSRSVGGRVRLRIMAALVWIALGAVLLGVCLYMIRVLVHA